MNAERRQNLSDKQKQRWAENERIAALLGTHKIRVESMRPMLSACGLLQKLLAEQVDPADVENGKQYMERQHDRTQKRADCEQLAEWLGEPYSAIEVSNAWSDARAAGMELSYMAICCDTDALQKLRSLLLDRREAERQLEAKTSHTKTSHIKTSHIKTSKLKAYEPVDDGRPLDTAGELRVAMWFINKIGDADRALRVVQAAVAATKALSEPVPGD